MSEVLTLRDLAKEYLNNLFYRAKPDSLFLVIDNNNPEFYGWFDELAEIHNIHIIKSAQSNMTLPFEEEKSDLKPSGSDGVS